MSLKLSAIDLKRFGPKLLADLATVYPEYKFSFLLQQDAIPNLSLETAAWQCPLIFNGLEFGYLAVIGAPLAEDEKRKMLSVVQLALEKLAFYKAHLSDLETGFYNRAYLSRYLAKSIFKKCAADALAPLSVDRETRQNSLCLVMVELKEEQRKTENDAADLKSLARFLSRNLKTIALSRIGARRLAFIINSETEGLTSSLEKLLEEFCAREPLKPILGWAAFPKDLWPFKQSKKNEAIRRLARGLWEKASVALFQAKGLRHLAPVVGFADLVENLGQVVQILPLDRVVINLGQAMGVASGQVFLVESAEEKAEQTPLYKGEVTVFEAFESYAIGHISQSNTSRRVVAGDRLRFSRNEWRPEVKQKVALNSPLAKLNDRENFLGKMSVLESGVSWATLLIRLDGHEKISSLMGHEEGEKRLAFVLEKAQNLGPVELCGRWSQGIAALTFKLAEGANSKDFEGAVRSLLPQLNNDGPVSLGLAFWPSPILENLPALALAADKALGEAAFLGPGQMAVFGPLALNISGDRIFEDGDYHGALKEYEKGLCLAPTNLNLLNSYGVSLGRLGHFHEALAAFDKIISCDAGHMMAHYNRGYTFLLAGQLEEAEKSLAQATLLSPDNFEALFHLGKTALELGHLEKAKDALSRAGQLDQRKPSVYRLLGEALIKARDVVGAMDAFKKAVKIDPHDAFALSSLGALYQEEHNDLSVAQSLFQKSVELDPTNSLYRHRLGRLLFILGEYPLAKIHLEAAVEYGSRAPEVHYHLGCLAQELGDLKAAPKYFQEALKQDPGYQPALQSLAENQKDTENKS